jgi:hypothetical protein
MSIALIFEAAKQTQPTKLHNHTYQRYQHHLPSAIMKSLSLALTFLASSTAQELCLPLVRAVTVTQTTTAPIHMFEVLVMDENNIVNWASPLVNPMSAASQSSTIFPASSAVDGDLSTFSHTSEEQTDNVDGTVWWKVDLGEAHTVGEVIIENR